MGQQGNILFLILIAVALFAALSYAVTSSSRSGGATISKDKAKIAAAEIVQYGAQAEQVINKLRVINGCKASQLSFEKSPFDGSDVNYVNPNSPNDFTCHFFHPNGGSFYELEVQEPWLDMSQSATNNFGKIVFMNHLCIMDVPYDSGNCRLNGIDDNELILVLPWIKSELCVAINNLLSINKDTQIPPQDYNAELVFHTTDYFDGTFEEDKSHISHELAGYYAACGEFESGSRNFSFYKTLWAR